MQARGRHAVAAVLIAGFTVVLYAGSLRNGFVWDDNLQLVRNPMLHPGQPIKPLLVSDVWAYESGGEKHVSNYYRPLQMLTYRMVLYVAGLDAAAFHAVSIALNLLAALAAYLIFYELSRRVKPSGNAPFGMALAAALLFCAHPIHTEAVLWIAALPELGCALFYFVAFWLFLLADRPRENAIVDSTAPKAKRRRGNVDELASSDATPFSPRAKLSLQIASCASYFLALFWKEMALTFPIVVAAYGFLTVRRTAAASAAESRDDEQQAQRRTAGFHQRIAAAGWKSLPYWALTVLYVAIRIAVLGYFSKVQAPLAITPGQYVGSVLRLAMQYWAHLLWPVPLRSWYIFHPASGLADPAVIAAALLLIAIVGLVVVLAKRAPVAAFAVAWVLMTLLPVFNLRGIGENAFTERYLYLPSLGFCLLLPLAWNAAMEKMRPDAAAGSRAERRARPPSATNAPPRWLGRAVLALVIANCAAAVWMRIPEWRDDRAFLESALRHEPDAPMHNDLGNALRSAGDLDGAVREYEAALALSNKQHKPSRGAMAYVGLAGIAWRRGQSQLSLDLARKGLELNPTLASLNDAEALALLQMGRFAEAEAPLRKALQTYPLDEVAFNALGVIASNRGDYATAVEFFRKAVDVLPTYAEARYNLGLAHGRLGAWTDAVPELQRAVELQPADPEYRVSYAEALMRMRNLRAARDQLQYALQLSPRDPAVQRRLAELNQRLGTP